MREDTAGRRFREVDALRMVLATPDAADGVLDETQRALVDALAAPAHLERLGPDGRGGEGVRTGADAFLPCRGRCLGKAETDGARGTRVRRSRISTVEPNATGDFRFAERVAFAPRPIRHRAYGAAPPSPTGKERRRGARAYPGSNAVCID